MIVPEPAPIFAVVAFVNADIVVAFCVNILTVVPAPSIVVAFGNQMFAFLNVNVPVVAPTVNDVA